MRGVFWFANLVIAQWDTCASYSGSGDVDYSADGSGSGDFEEKGMMVDFDIAKDMRSGSVRIEGDIFDNCTVTVETDCKEVAFRFETFRFSAFDDNCTTEFIAVESEWYDSGPICSEDGISYEWTVVDLSNKFNIEMEGMGAPLSTTIFFGCVEDLLGLPECAVSDGEYLVEYFETGNMTYSTIDARDTLQFDNSTEMECPDECFSKAGCSTFSYSEERGCEIYLGSVVEDQSLDGAYSGMLHTGCPTPFYAQFELEYSFYCRFLSPTADSDALIDRFNFFNLDVWQFYTTNSRMYNVQEETKPGSAIATGSPDGNGRFNIWIKLTVRLFYRSVLQSRKRSTNPYEEALTESLSIAEDAVQDLQETTVGDDFTLEDTTSVEKSVKVLSESGEVSGTCDSDSSTCDCAEGFEADDQGNCVAPEPEIPSPDECDFSLYPDKSAIDMAAYISVQCTPNGYSVTGDRCALELFGFAMDDLAIDGQDRTYDGPLRTDDQNTCKGFRSTGTDLMFEVTGINACGGEKESNGTHVTIQNALRGMVGEVTDIIDRRIETFISFSCVFQTEIQVSLFDSGSLASLKTSQGHEEVALEAVESSFDFELAIYADETYTDVLPVDHVFNVPELIFVGAVSTAPTDRYHLSVENCYFTKEPESTADVAHQIMESGCPTSSEMDYVNIYENHESHEARIGIQSFVFSTDESESIMYLHCKLQLCDHQSETCTQDCSASRKRRSATDELELMVPLHIGKTKQPALSRVQRIMRRLRLF